MATIIEAEILNLARNNFGSEFEPRIVRTERKFRSIGDLYILEAVRPNPRWVRPCYAIRSRDEAKFFASPEELLIWIGSQKEQRRMFQNADIFTTVSGAIAIMITIVISAYLFLRGSDIPQVLSNALTMILGFYFGRQSAGPATTQSESNQSGP